MQENNNDYLDNLKRYWRNFIKRGVESENIRPTVLASWKRSIEYGVDPYRKRVTNVLDQNKLEQLRSKNKKFIEISKPVLQNLCDFIANSGFVIALSDADGIIMEIMGDITFKNIVVNDGFVEGADWNEKTAGTNAIGTALFTGHPIMLYSYEHFCIGSQQAACCCAPIKNIDGKIIGAVNMSGDFKNLNNHTLGMVVITANAIENVLRIIHEEQKYQIANAYKNILIDSISDGVIATDTNGVITHINRIAAHILGVGTDVHNRHIKNILPPNNSKFINIFSSDTFVTDEDIGIYTTEGLVKVTVTSRRIVSDLKCNGIVVVMNELKRAKKIAHRFSGAIAKLTFDNLLGENTAFIESKKMAYSASSCSSTVLLLGESGTGKDVIAQAIHNKSARRNGPFVAINCGALPKELIASELFGFVDGAFTGARRGGNPGKFELADGGTLFLDEIGEMPLELQVNLLRVLEEKACSRIGGTEVVPLDVRIIASTNRNLLQLIAEGGFREDLYYRLNVIAIQTIPLRERKDDIPMLVKHFYKQIKGQHFDEKPIPDEYIHALQTYNWPGNIRELQNVIERSISLSDDGIPKLKYLPDEVKSSGKQINNGTKQIQNMEKELILHLIDLHKGNLTKVAFEMGVARTTLYRKLNKYKIDT